jgi:type IV secretory pathway VirJ component
MLQPVNLQLAHFNVEHSAQISKDAIAAAQQTAQGQEVVQESVKRTQMVQASLAAADAQKVKRKEDEQARRQRGQRQSFSESSETPEENSELTMQTEARSLPKNFDFYA